MAIEEIGSRQSRVWEDVEVGEVLPRLEFPITMKTMVLAVCGTRDLMPYHHDPAYSKSVGNRDMFVNTMFDQALFGRYVGDWSGPESDFRETDAPDGRLALSGRSRDRRGARDGEDGVGRRIDSSRSRWASRVRITGLAATATATLAMPSRTAGPVEAGAAAREARRGAASRDARLREGLAREAGAALRSRAIPSPRSRSSTGATWSRTRIPSTSTATTRARAATAASSRRRWGSSPGRCSAPGARASIRRAGLQLPRAQALAADRGHSRARSRVRPACARRSRRARRSSTGSSLRPGDRVSSTTEVVNCSPLKQTRLGPGYFQTNLDTYYNQNDEIVGTDLMSVLWYGFSE